MFSKLVFKSANFESAWRAIRLWLMLPSRAEPNYGLIENVGLSFLNLGNLKRN
jgi:hypothetical protein